MSVFSPAAPASSRKTVILFLVFCLVFISLVPAPCSALEAGIGTPGLTAGSLSMPLFPVLIAPLQVATKAPINVSTTSPQYTFQTPVPTRTPIPAATPLVTINPVSTTPAAVPFRPQTTFTLLPMTTVTLNFATTRTILACPAGMTTCNDECVNLNTDIDHCGSCDNFCTRCSNASQPPLVCRSGTCMRDCGNGYTDIESDPNNCGCCGNTVNPPMTCHNGSFSIFCNGQYYPSSDINNCGDCGVQCHPEQNERCLGGTCSCIQGYTRCNGICIPTRNDTMNCGACGVQCRADQICHQGQCRCPPSIGIPGGGDGFECNGVCADLASDIRNCGACGHSCGGNAASNETRCDYGECKAICENGQYTNTDTDRNNCGGCMLHCAEWEDCIEGECTRRTCMYGETLCGGTCTDIRSDRNNCGLCGYRCSGGYDCVNGQCYNPQSCPSGWADCDDDNRCENLSTGSGGYYCGSCDTMCPHNEACHAGRCVVTCPQGYSKCNRACQNLMGDPENCGGCGHRCTNTEVCEAGNCITPCPDGSRRCNGRCMSWSEFYQDTNNCGTCGNRCNIMCVMGICLFG